MIRGCIMIIFIGVTDVGYFELMGMSNNEVKH